MRLTIEIDLGNDAMQTGTDAGVSISETLVRAAPFDPLEAGDGGAIVDANGNTVGRWKVRELADLIAEAASEIIGAGGRMGRSQALAHKRYRMEES